LLIQAGLEQNSRSEGNAVSAKPSGRQSRKISVRRPAAHRIPQVASTAVLSGAEQQSINTSVSTLQSRLGLHFELGAIKQHFQFGSFTRGTILSRSMDEQSDIDHMIVFNDASATPQTYLNRLWSFVAHRYATSEVYQSQPTIVLELNHIKFDLVPATINWLGQLQIPNGSGGWQTTNPNNFNATLEAKNKGHRSLIKPTIRLFKFWNATSGFLFPSYELEKWVCSLQFWFLSNQRDYYFAVIDSLGTHYSNTQKINSEITRAKVIVQNTKRYEANGQSALAESEIRKLFRL
jgi:hypothetical protein